jgi:nucleotide-binding universal stress UspA family protein
LNVKILVDAEMGEFEKELHESARRHLAEVRERALDRKIVVEEVLLTGNVETVVPKEVEARGVDLIALGGFQSSKVTRDLLARQRQQIIDRAACPVLVVK